MENVWELKLGINKVIACIFRLNNFVGRISARKKNEKKHVFKWKKTRKENEQKELNAKKTLERKQNGNYSESSIELKEFQMFT